MRTCPFCGTENEPFFRFCLGCGEDLDKVFAPAPAATPEPAPPARREPSREIVAVRAEPPRVAAAAGIGSPPLSRTSLRRPSTGLVSDATVETPAAFPVAEPTIEAITEPVPSATQRVDGQTTTPRREAAQPPSRRIRRRVATASLIQVFDNGNEELVAELSPTPLVIGRSEEPWDASEGPWDTSSTVFAFPDDDFMGPRHVVLFVDFDGVMVEPLPTTNGVFMQLTEPHFCGTRAVFRIGQQLLQIDRIDELARRAAAKSGDAGLLGSPIPDSAWGRLAQLITPSQFGEVHLLGGDQVRLGRERGDINFPSDLFVSGLHATLRWREGGIVLEDTGSSNGTYVQLEEPTRISVTTSILVGQQLFRIEINHG